MPLPVIAVPLFSPSYLASSLPVSTPRAVAHGGGWGCCGGCGCRRLGVLSWWQVLVASLAVVTWRHWCGAGGRCWWCWTVMWPFCCVAVAVGVVTRPFWCVVVAVRCVAVGVTWRHCRWWLVVTGVGVDGWC